MSQQDETGETDGEKADAAGQLTLDALNRYLAASAEDREAAEERSAQVIARFTKLTIAMMCVTMVIAGANAAMIIRQSSAPPSIVMAPPQPMETPTLVVQPAQPALPAPAPAPAPLESIEPARPAEKIPLLGSPPPARPRAAPAAMAPRMARATISTPPRPQPLLSVRNTDNDAHETGAVERW
jgi:hypothetical protein